MDSQPRNRIVINLDAPQQQRKAPKPAGRAGKRWPKVLAFLVLVLGAGIAVASIGGYLSWRQYQKSVSYSLALIVDAAQRNDMAAFDRLADTDKIAENLVPQVSEKAEGLYGLVTTPAARKQVATPPPSLLPRLKQTVRDGLIQEIKEFSATSAQRPFIVVALTMPSLVKITTEGNSAKVTATRRGQTLELTMQKEGDVWKVIGVKDDSLVERLINDLAKDLVPVGRLDGADVRKRTKKRRGSLPDLPPQR